MTNKTTFEILSPGGTPLLLASFPNKKEGGPIAHVYVRNDDELRKALETYDHPGRAVYFTVAQLKEGADRRKENVLATFFVWAEVDFKDHPDFSPDEIKQRIMASPMPPTYIFHSGNGYHCYWQFNEALDIPYGPEQQKFEQTLRLACKHVGGDPNVAEAARLMRVLGSHNSKYGDSRHVHPIFGSNHTYELSDLAEHWLDARPLLPEPHRTNGAAGAADVGASGEKPPVTDPDAELAAMEPSGTDVNRVQCRIIGHLIHHAEHPDDILERLVNATMAMAKRHGLAWTKEREVKDVCERILNFLNDRVRKYDVESGAVPSWLAGEFHQKWVSALLEGKQIKFGRNPSGFFLRGDWPKGEAPLTSEIPKGTTEEPKAPKAPDKAPEKRRILELRPFQPFDVAQLPPRSWLYGKHYQRRTVSLTAGPGGMGKSSLNLVEAVAMATGRNLLGEQPEERRRVWYHNGEDPREEIDRRLAAICQYYKIPHEELVGWLWTTAGTEFPLRVAKGYSNLEINDVLLCQISDAIAQNQIDLAQFDPLVTLHSVSEMDPGKMDTVIRLFASIADENDAAIELAHHVRKPANGVSADYGVNDIRGVQAITDACRAARVLNRMNEEDAESACCDDVERMSRFRVDRAKGNYSAAEAATWRRFVTVTIANGDEVGVVAPWEFPGQGAETPEKKAADAKADHMFLHLLDKFTARGENVSVSGPNYAPAKFAKDKEAKLPRSGRRP
jgi:RecA-family ATPase